MYICLNCGSTFDTPASYEEWYPYGDTYVSEIFVCCPCCRENDFVQLIECEECGEPIIGEYIELNSNGKLICEECYTVHSIED